MNIDFDCLRLGIAGCYNDLAETEITEEQKQALTEMRGLIGGLLAIYDPNDPEINAIHDQIALVDIEEKP